MSRLVAVSNRVAVPKGGSPPAGGLAVGVLGAMRACGGMWFGWSGATTANDAPLKLETVVRDGITFATMSLPEGLHERSYSGFANGTLWPLFHYFLDGFRYEDGEYEAYCEVNEIFARELVPRLRKDDLIWIHDYHLIPLGERLRERGVSMPLGFFLHIPFPHFEVLRALPKCAEMMRAMLSYDVIGFQTSADRQAFLGAVQALWGGECVSAAGTIRLSDRTVLTGVYPIGVDVEAIARSATKAMSSARVERMKDGLLGRRLIMGVDRLDYSKGLLERFEAYRHFLTDCPEHLGRVTYLQIAPIGRQNVKAYARIRDALEQSSGCINGRFADVDWTPVRYLNRNFPHATLMGFLRLAHACLVTPVRDGMNLVAKEFVAAQDPADPGVLILSDRAGAACELTEALLVNPYDIRGIARALKHSLEMPLEERRSRHEKLLAALGENDIHAWYGHFLEALRRPHGRVPDGRGLKLSAA